MLRFFVFENRTVLPDSHHSGIVTVSTCRTVNAFLNAFCAGSNFFYQKFWMAGAVQFFCLAISFFMFSSVMESPLTRFALSPSSTFTSSIHSIFSIGLFCSQGPLQNSTNLCISAISISGLSTASRVGKNPFWSRWNMILCFLRLRFSMYFSTSLFCHESYQAIAP